jgi:hypothetical protein
MCFFLVLLLLGPRVTLIIFWLFQTSRFNMVFDSIIWPLLGVLFLPWTTLMYVIVSPGGFSNWDWFWIGLMLLADILSYVGGKYRYHR